MKPLFKKHKRIINAGMTPDGRNLLYIDFPRSKWVDIKPKDLKSAEEGDLVLLSTKDYIAFGFIKEGKFIEERPND